jgi:NAD(P)-dependent dehydrogenase (short-subunit alcohol dehydrogenase family)
MSSLFDVKGKIVLITGGGGVLGSGMGNVLAQNGATVGIIGLTI